MTRWPRARDNHPGQRENDQGSRSPSLWGFMRRYILPATAWSFLASVIAVVALIVGFGNQTDIQHGRRDAIKITCAVESAVSEAGQKVITSAMPLPPGVERLLDSHGFPPFRLRRLAAQRAARAYVASISRAVEAQVGRRGDGLVKHDGTLNCERLLVLAKAK